jgi:hypothetical protein
MRKMLQKDGLQEDELLAATAAIEKEMR